MKKLLKTLHFIGLAIFFGSIAAYIFFGSQIPKNDLAALTLNRQWVASATAYLTIPAMWLVGLTGLLMSGKPKRRWLWIKLVTFAVIALNTHLFIFPAILASLSFVGGNPDLFSAAMQREAGFGALNVLLILTLIGIATFKPPLGQKP